MYAGLKNIYNVSKIKKKGGILKEKKERVFRPKIFKLATGQMERGKRGPETRKVVSGYGECHYPKKWPLLRFFTREKTWVNPVETLFRVTFQKPRIFGIFDFEIPVVFL